MDASFDVASTFGCACPTCAGGLTRHGDDGGVVLSASLDPSAGSTYGSKPVWSAEQAAIFLNRAGQNWNSNNYGELDDGVLNYGFWLTQEELANSYYVNETGTAALNEYFSFGAFTPAQIDLAQRSIAFWDEVTAISFRQTKSGSADITFGNANTGGAQAYAYLPFGDSGDAQIERDYGFAEFGRLGGDVWVDIGIASNFTQLTASYYGQTAMIHEIGHALGISHPGDYNALDDNDGDGVPDPITYANDAVYAQDSRQYSIMSYFDAYETGAQHIDFALLNVAYPGTPLVHDIAAAQRLYGVDTTTRTGNTVYGFNSTAGNAAYDFSVTTSPVVAIWDAGGIDTLDLSGWNTPSTIDLNEGAFSSGGGIEAFLTLDQINANRAAAGLDPRSAGTFAYFESFKQFLGLKSGLLTDNISIAYGVVIENAVGGGGSDRIVGNGVANLLTGGGGRDVFELRSAGVSGADRITDWQRGDVLATTKAIADGNGDGIITWSGASLMLDRTDGDRVELVGAAKTGLRLMGSIDGVFYYDDARIRPVASSGQRVYESGFGDDTMRGRSSGSSTDVFFFDTANPVAGLGNDIVVFTRNDLFVTTTKLADADGDNRITFGSDGLLDLTGEGGTVKFGGASALEYDGVVVNDGIEYYVYSQVGSSIGIGGLHV